MSKNKFHTKRMCDIKNGCKEIGNQYIFLVTIIAAIISQEIDDNTELDNLAGFLIVLGEQLAFASAIRETCESNLDKENQDINPELSIDKDRSLRSSPNKKVVKKVKRKIKRNSSR